MIATTAQVKIVLGDYDSPDFRHKEMHLTDALDWIKMHLLRVGDSIGPRPIYSQGRISRPPDIAGDGSMITFTHISKRGGEI